MDEGFRTCRQAILEERSNTSNDRDDAERDAKVVDERPIALEFLLVSQLPQPALIFGHAASCSARIFGIGHIG